MADNDDVKIGESVYVICEPDGWEWGGDVVAVTRSPVIAGMARQGPWQVWQSIPILTGTAAFIELEAGNERVQAILRQQREDARADG